jgi:hypothetical protein
MVAPTFFLSSFCFCSIIDPPPLNVQQVCGTAIVANAELKLKPSKLDQSAISTQSDKIGNFDFGEVPTGEYRLSMMWPDKAGKLDGPISNSYPIKVVSSKVHSGCQRPLEVSILSGTESGIKVSFKSESK